METSADVFFFNAINVMTHCHFKLDKDRGRQKAGKTRMEKCDKDRVREFVGTQD